MDGGAWWATVHGMAKSRTRLSDFTITTLIAGKIKKEDYFSLACLQAIIIIGRKKMLLKSFISIISWFSFIALFTVQHMFWVTNA